MIYAANGEVYDKRITIRAIPATADALNAPTGTGTAVATNIPAQRRILRGKERTDAMRDAVEQEIVFRIRWRGDIQEQMTVDHGSETYRIERIEEKGRRQDLDLFTIRLR